jgi:lipoprotein-releasing system permease protein
MLFLALRQMLYRRRQTLLVLLGIALGPMAFLMMSGMILGFRGMFMDRLIDMTGHISISAQDQQGGMDLKQVLFPGALTHWWVEPVGLTQYLELQSTQTWLNVLEAEPAVEAYAPQYVVQCLIAKAVTTRSIRLVGVLPARQMKATHLDQDVVEGRFQDIGKGGFQVILGMGLHDKMGIRKGNIVRLIAPDGSSESVTVAGFFLTGASAIDDSTAYGPLEHVQQFSQRPGRLTGIVVRLKDVTQAQPLADRWARLGTDKVQSWEEAQANFKTMVETQDIMRFTLVFVILLVAAFGIYNILSMMVVQKRGEIAILRAMGYGPGDIVRLFLVQGVLLGALGGALGLVLGTLACLYLGTLTINTPVAAMRHFPIAWDLGSYLLVFSLSLAAGVAAGYLPARMASRLNPIDILRTEG